MLPLFVDPGVEVAKLDLIHVVLRNRMKFRAPAMAAPLMRLSSREPPCTSHIMRLLRICVILHTFDANVQNWTGLHIHCNILWLQL